MKRTDFRIWNSSIRGLILLSVLTFSAVAIWAQTGSSNGASLLEEQLTNKFGKASISAVTFPEGRIRIQTNLLVVNDAIYKTVLIETCRVVVENPTLFPNLREVVITNERERQGYIYKTPSKCGQLNGTTVEESGRTISEDTSFCNGRCE